jgi:hypothetical protein
MIDVHPKHYKCQHKAQEDQPTQILHGAFFYKAHFLLLNLNLICPFYTILHPTQNYPNRRNLPEAD